MSVADLSGGPISLRSNGPVTAQLDDEPGSRSAAPDGPVWDALRGVLDPELGIDVVSLGLVYGVAEAADSVVVEMTLTTPGCPAAESLPAMAACAVECALPGKSAEVKVVWDPPWSPAMIDDESAAALGFRSR